MAESIHVRNARGNIRRSIMKRADVRVVALYGQSWAVYGPTETGYGRIYAIEGYERAEAAAVGYARSILAAEAS